MSLKFSEVCKSKSVTLSDDRSSGTHSKHHAASDNKYADVLYGALLSEKPIKPCGDGFYFEVRVDSVTTGEEDGLAVGVTTTSPEELIRKMPNLPEVAASVPNSWVVGLTGVAHCSVGDKDGNFVDLSWSPQNLKEGDRVGLLVTHERKLCVVENGRDVVWGPHKVEAEEPLYALVDLLGNTTGVTLLPDAKPPETLKEHYESKTKRRASVKEAMMDDVAKGQQKQQQEGEPKRAGHEERPLLFCPHVSNHVALSKDRLSARLSDSKPGSAADDDELYGVLLTQNPVPEFKEGVYFEVTVESVKQDEDDGLTMGVTTTSPKDLEAQLPDLPEVSAAVANSWVIGFTGMVHCSFGDLDGQFIDIPWKPQDLKVGDHVGVFVTYGGLMIVVENGKPVAIGPHPVAMDQGPLYGIVDLLGNTSGVALVPGAKPPPGLAQAEEAKKVWEKERLRIAEASSLSGDLSEGSSSQTESDAEEATGERVAQKSCCENPEWIPR